MLHNSNFRCRAGYFFLTHPFSVTSENIIIKIIHVYCQSRLLTMKEERVNPATS